MIVTDKQLKINEMLEICLKFIADGSFFKALGSTGLGAFGWFAPLWLASLPWFGPLNVAVGFIGKLFAIGAWLVTMWLGYYKIKEIKQNMKDKKEDRARALEEEENG